MLGDGIKPLPTSFLEWQVQLRAWTMEQRHGAPHAGVAPLVTVRVPGSALGVISHSIICGLLPRDLDEKTKSWRAVAGKTFLFFGAAAGVGQDTYESNSNISVFIAPRPASEGGSGGPIALQQKLTRTNYFGSVWINAQVLRIVGEVGQATGGEVLTYNQFTGPQPDDARPYFSVGVSLGW